MDNVINKSLSLIVFILIGVLLKKRFSKPDEINGLKNLILTLALPATIFIALLKIKIDSNLLVLPLFAILFNVLLFIITPLLLVIIGIPKKSPTGNTARLLIPSLAPGLSCFPFILEFLGDNYLAKAAMADLGNKFFVLVILYLVAIKWHYLKVSFNKKPIAAKLKILVITMFTAPVNVFIFVALILLFFGINMQSLPDLISGTLTRLSLIMTPLVLLFIGLGLKLKEKQFLQIFSLLMLRSAVSFFAVSIIIAVFSIEVKNDILFILAFSLSACSFWPFAHISNISIKEENFDSKSKTFDVDAAMSILALSLPLSVVMILIVLTADTTFTKIDTLIPVGFGLLLLGGLFPIINKIKEFYSTKKIEGLDSKLMSSNSDI